MLCLVVDLHCLHYYDALISTQVLILAMIVAGAWKYGKLKHPATFVAIAVNLFIFLLEPLGRFGERSAFLKEIIKG